MRDATGSVASSAREPAASFIKRRGGDNTAVATSSCAPRSRTTPWPPTGLRREAEALGLTGTPTWWRCTSTITSPTEPRTW